MTYIFFLLHNHKQPIHLFTSCEMWRNTGTGSVISEYITMRQQHLLYCTSLETCPTEQGREQKPASRVYRLAHSFAQMYTTHSEIEWLKYVWYQISYRAPSEESSAGSICELWKVINIEQCWFWGYSHRVIAKQHWFFCEVQGQFKISTDDRTYGTSVQSVVQLFPQGELS